MWLQKDLRILISGLILTTFVFSTYAAANISQDKKAVSEGKSVLWQEPGNIAERSLYRGSGSESRAPKPPFRFVKEDPKGSQPKIEITDGTGEKWKVKFGEEVHAEIAGTRLLWALGYKVEETYFLPAGNIAGITQLGRAGRFINPDGSFQNARFEKRPNNITRTKTSWSWSKNPFVGTKELSGLRILMTMINNWDTRAVSKNNTVLSVATPGGVVEDWYVVEDLGSSFGRMGRYPIISTRNRWDLEDFKKQKFIDGVSGNMLDLHYKGGARSIDKVPLEHARWFAGLVSQLTEKQVRQAFEAAGASPAEIEGFSSRIMEKIRELQNAVNESPRP